MVVFAVYFSLSALSYTTTVPYAPPDEDSKCWVEQEDGVLTRCQLTSEFPPEYNPIPHPILQDIFCEQDCKTNDTVLIGGKWASEICGIMGYSCATYYPGMINHNGSITSGQIIHDHGITEYYQFLIQDGKLSHAKSVMKNEN